MTADHKEKVLALFPALDREKQNISLSLYRLLAEGKPASHEQLGVATGIEEARVEQVLMEWPGVFYNDQRQVIGYWGLALPKMGHQFRINGTDLHTWCAWDSLFIPQLLGVTADVESVCPVTQKPIRLTVSPHGVEQVTPPTAVMSLMVPSDESVIQDIVKRFCHYVHFFESWQSARQWTAENPSTVVMEISDAFDLGREKNYQQFPDSRLD